MHYKTQSTIKLPRRLLEELGGSVEDSSGSRSKRYQLSSRKEQRKAARVQKKSNHFYKQALHTPAIGPKSRQHIGQSNSSVFPQQPNSTVTSVKRITPKSILKTTQFSRPAKEAFTDLPRSSTSPSPAKISRVVQDRLAKDDAEIAALERALGMKEKKNLPKSFAEDGLDSLIDNVDDAAISEKDPLGKRKRKEEEEWLHSKRQKAQAKIMRNVDSKTNESSEDQADFSLGEFSKEPKEDGAAYQASDLDESDGLFSNEEDDDMQLPPISNRQRENPYVAPVIGTPVKYISPSLRNRDTAESPDIDHLRRHLQGLLNRLSEANILSILDHVEQTYRDHPRQHVSTTLLDLLMSLLADPTILPDTFIILHAGFIAAVYKVVGTEFGAQTIQRIDEELQRNYEQRSRDKIRGKKLTNMVNLLAQLYTFQVIGSGLIFDFIRLCLEDLSETSTELLLRIVLSAGPQLRRDDSSALKDIVESLQVSVRNMREKSLSPRSKFMIETLQDLKNNRMQKGVSAATINSEHTMRMKRTLGSLSTRSLRASEPLRIVRKDIQNRDKIGKWWLLGARYEDENRERNDDQTSARRSPVKPLKSKQKEDTHIGQNDLLQIAREQRMNTDVRRSIFVAIMSSLDHKDAYERLMKLRLKNKQAVEIPKVIVHCAGAEKSYNPFYALLSQRLCSGKNAKYSFQIALWNIFTQTGASRDGSYSVEEENEEEEQLDLRSLVNLAKLFGILIAERNLSLDTLKILNLTSLQSQTQTFLEILMITAMLHSQDYSETKRRRKALLAIFLEAKEISQMAPVLCYFLRKILSKTDLADSDSDKKTLNWACGVACDALMALPAKTVAGE